MVRKTLNDFISKSKTIFSDDYTYEKTNYINAKTEVIITCKIHGDFNVIPNKHTSSDKQGCPTCSKIKKRKTTTTKING